MILNNSHNSFESYQDLILKYWFFTLDEKLGLAKAISVILYINLERWMIFRCLFLIKR